MTATGPGFGVVHGEAYRFGDNINTDYIIAAHHKVNASSLSEMATHAFADIDPEFVNRIQPGDILVAGRNFGCGSSREAAVWVLKEVGIAAVLAQSFARIFFRNAINAGLPALECDTRSMSHGDRLEVSLADGYALGESSGIRLSVAPLPSVMRDVLAAGGLRPYIRKNGDFIINPA